MKIKHTFLLSAAIVIGLAAVGSASVEVGGFATFAEMTSASVPVAKSGRQRAFIDSADHKMKRKDSSGVVTTIEGGGGGSSYYQTVQSAGSDQTQRDKLNFSSFFAVSDSSSPSRTTVSPNSAMLAYDFADSTLGASTSTNTTSTSYADISGFSSYVYSAAETRTYTLRAKIGGLYGNISTLTRGVIAIDVGGSIPAGCEEVVQFSSLYYVTSEIACRAALTAGNNTLKLRWKVADGQLNLDGTYSSQVRATRRFEVWQ